jgi:hypothetical protein
VYSNDLNRTPFKLIGAKYIRCIFDTPERSNSGSRVGDLIRLSNIDCI